MLFKRLVKKILIVLFFIGSAAIFAKEGLENYPWYFEDNNIISCWDNGITGKGVVVEVWDSKVSFVSLLADKKYGHKNYTAGCSEKKWDNKVMMHGTGMASIIASDHGSVECSIRSAYSCEESFIAGLAPDSRIFNREIIDLCGNHVHEDRINILKEAMDSKDKSGRNTNLNAFGKKIILEEDIKKRTAKIILINASFCEGRGQYIELMRGFLEHENYPYLLIIAGVGNVSKEVNEKNLPYPARLKVNGLSVLRVGATNKYSSKSEIDILDFSKEGSSAGSAFGEVVDILAPGNKIPILTHDAKAYIGDGTSESTAIITGALALIGSCNPRATADELKQALLDYSDKYDRLKKKVKSGRVLNIGKAIENYCQSDSGSEIENSHWYDQTQPDARAVIFGDNLTNLSDDFFGRKI